MITSFHHLRITAFTPFSSCKGILLPPEGLDGSLASHVTLESPLPMY